MILRRLLIALSALPLAYAAAALVLPLVPVTGEPEVERGVEVFVCTNGVHTDLILPAASGGLDWTVLLPRSDFPLASPEATHVSFGWGDRAFYLETRRWTDLRPVTAWRALFGGGPSVLHVSYSASPAGSPDCGHLMLGGDQYARLSAAVRASFREPVQPILGASYGGTDRFYPAEGSYSPFDTCNQWTARALKAGGVTMGLWTPLESGVMRWVRTPGRS